MKDRLFLYILLAAGIVVHAGAQETVEVDPTTAASQIINMDLQFIDASALALTSVESLHSTGTPQAVDLASWRLTVSGEGVATILSLTCEELLKLPMVKKGTFDLPCLLPRHLEWEGVPLQTLLKRARAGDFTRAVFTSVDGYRGEFKKEET